MKFFDKFKGMFKDESAQVNKRSVLKFVGLVSLAIGSVAAVTVSTIAWFNLGRQDSKIKMVSGDLGVEIQKVTAYTCPESSNCFTY